jgi:6,7-dimethyl-8-ribityllumazine synthase
MSLQAPSISAVSGAAFTVGIVAARYNEAWVDALLDRALAVFRAAGVKPRNLAILRVPGSGELPVAVQGLAARLRPDVLLALGVIVRGDTIHFELLAEAVGHGLQRVALDARIPVVNGVVVAATAVQAAARSRGRINRGAEFAQAALAMAALKRKGWR